MIELLIGNYGYRTNAEKAYKVEVLNYDSREGFTDLTKLHRTCSGTYVSTYCKAIDIGSSLVYNEFINRRLIDESIIIFDSINIKRDLTIEEKESNQAIEDYLGIEIDKAEAKIGDTYNEIERFKEAISVLKNKETVNSLIPVKVDNIAFIVKDNTEEDFILSREFDFVDVLNPREDITLNIYKLWS